jgi:hypothetical protein
LYNCRRVKYTTRKEVKKQLYLIRKKEIWQRQIKTTNALLSGCALGASTTNRIAVQPPATNRTASATRNAGGGGRR